MSRPHALAYSRGVASEVTVTVVDGYAVARVGLKALIDAAPGMRFVGEAATCEEAVRRVGLDSPDVVVMNLRLPDGSGVDACRAIKQSWPNIAVLMFTAYADPDALLDSVDAGASGYLLKRVDADAIVEGIRRVAAGEQLFGPELDGALALRVREGHTALGKLGALSPQEQRVLSHLEKGKSNRTIATEMCLSERTVKNYVSHILTKLGMESRTEVAAFAIAAAAKRATVYPDQEWHLEG